MAARAKREGESVNGAADKGNILICFISHFSFIVCLSVVRWRTCTSELARKIPAGLADGETRAKFSSRFFLRLPLVLDSFGTYE